MTISILSRSKGIVFAICMVLIASAASAAWRWNPDTKARDYYEADAQDIRTSATPTFSGLSLSTPLPVASGGTGTSVNNTVKILSMQNVASAVTGTTGETALYTLTIPGNTIGSNGIVHVVFLESHTSNGNVKTVKLKINSTVFFTANYTTTTISQPEYWIRNRNATNSQVSASTGLLAAGGPTSGTIVTSAIDTTADTTLTITGTLASAGDTIQLESVFVEIIPSI